MQPRRKARIARTRSDDVPVVDPDAGSAPRSLVGRAREALHAGHAAGATVGDQRLRLSTVFPSDRGILGLTHAPVDLPTLPGLDDIPGAVLLRTRTAGRQICGVRAARARVAPVEVRLLGWWKLMTPVEILGLTGTLPSGPIGFPGLAGSTGLTELTGLTGIPGLTAYLLTMDVAEASLRELSPDACAAPPLVLDDEEVRRFLLG